jgi:hypothetical protein
MGSIGEIMPKAVYPEGQPFYFILDLEDENVAEIRFIAPNTIVYPGTPGEEKPTYISELAPAPTIPPPAGPAGSRVFDVALLDGLRVAAGDKKVYSTGQMHPSKVTGWASPGNVQQSNDLYATTNAGAGYSAELVATGFGFNIPAGATITGIEVIVERSKV